MQIPFGSISIGKWFSNVRFNSAGISFRAFEKNFVSDLISIRNEILFGYTKDLDSIKKNPASNNDTFKLVIGILVNLHISIDILPRIYSVVS